MGIFTIASHTILHPNIGDKMVLLDGSTHRQNKPLFYNEYWRVSEDAEQEAERAVTFVPMMATYLIDYWLAEQKLFRATGVLILSASSSKTGLATALLLQQRDVDVIGLPAAENLSYVESLGCYERVLAYEDIGMLVDEAVVYLDIAGNSPLRRAVHNHYGIYVIASILIGITDWQNSAPTGNLLPGAKLSQFFVPTVYMECRDNLGSTKIQRQFNAT